MDTLTFGSKVLLRHLTFSEARKMDIKEFHLEKVLEGMGVSLDQFIDLCILLGCDYCEKIRGVGPKSAYKLIQEHGDIETILKQLDGKKHSAPENWLFAEARRLFKEPEVTPGEDLELKWTAPDVEGLVKFMCEQKGFAEDRVRKGAEKLAKARKGSTQGRLDGFFKVLGTSPAANGKKRKSEEAAGKGSAKKKPAAAGGKFRR